MHFMLLFGEKVVALSKNAWCKTVKGLALFLSKIKFGSEHGFSRKNRALVLFVLITLLIYHILTVLLYGMERQCYLGSLTVKLGSKPTELSHNNALCAS